MSDRDAKVRVIAAEDPGGAYERAALLPLVSGFVLWIAGLLVGAAATWVLRGTWLPISAVFSVLLLVVVSLLTARGRMAEPHHVLVARLAMVRHALIPFFGAAVMLLVPIVDGPLDLARGSDGVTMAVLLGIVAGPAVAIPLTFVSRFRPLALLVWRGLVGGIAATGVLAVLVLAGWNRARTRPDPDHYVATLPTVLTIPPGPQAGIAAPDGTLFGQACKTYVKVLPSRFKRTSMTVTECTPTVQRPGDPSPTAIAPSDGRNPGGPDAATNVSVDATAGYVFFGWPDERPSTIIERGGVTNLRDDLVPFHVRRSLSAPRAWLIAGSGGLMLALVALVRAAVQAFGLRRLDGAVSAMVHQEGDVVLADGTRCSLPDAPKEPGPVLVRLSGRPGSSREDAYRTGADVASAELVGIGTAAAVREAILVEAAGSAALAFAAAALFGAPLAAAALYGLVFLVRADAAARCRKRIAARSFCCFDPGPWRAASDAGSRPRPRHRSVLAWGTRCRRT